jgi:hypothetical protein
MDVDSNQGSALVSTHGFDRFPFCLFQGREDPMAETTKLSVEKALKKIRSADPKSKDERRNSEMEALEEDIKRMRDQRLRLERRQRQTKS